MITRALALTAACALLACARTEPPVDDPPAEHAQPAAPRAEAAVPSDGAAGSGLVQGTPAGGLGRWIADLRSGLDTLPALAGRDAAAAKNQALLLYVTRQEYIEIYYGASGRAVKDSALAESVTTAETRFHELLKAVNTPDGRIDARALRSAVSALDAQYDRVLERAAQLEIDVAELRLASEDVR